MDRLGQVREMSTEHSMRFVRHQELIMRKKLRQHVRRESLLTALVMAVASCLFIAPVARSQSGQGTVVGRVTDGRTSEGIARAAVRIDGSSLAANTDQDGRYRIPNVSAGTHTVTARRIGYGAGGLTVNVAGDQTVTANIALQVVATSLDQVVVTGTPGAQVAREIGNAVSTINAEDQLSKSEAPNLTALLNGRAAGVTVAQNTGRLGAGPNIQIRGVSSIGLNNNPLIYIDGVRVNNATGSGPTFNGGFGS